MLPQTHMHLHTALPAPLQINFYLGNAYLPLREVYQPEPAEAQPPASPATSGSDKEDVEGLEEDAGVAGLPCCGQGGGGQAMHVLRM